MEARLTHKVPVMHLIQRQPSRKSVESKAETYTRGHVFGKEYGRGTSSRTGIRQGPAGLPLHLRTNRGTGLAAWHA